MKKNSVIFGILVWLIGPWALADSLHNLFDSSRIPLFGPKRSMQKGAWASYRMTVAGRGIGFSASTTYRFKVSLPLHTDTQHPLKEGQYWLELEFSDPSEQISDFIAVKVLVEGDPRDSGSIESMYLRSGKQISFVLPKEKIKGISAGDASCAKGDQQKCRAGGGRVQAIAEKKIYTKLGWMESSGVQVEFPENKGKGEYWTSSKVPIFGIVKATLVNPLSSTILEIESFGNGALSRIDEIQAVPMPDPEELLKRLPNMR